MLFVIKSNILIVFKGSFVKILIVTVTFPPYSPVSGSRVNKFAKYMDQNGHDVKVLAPLRTDVGAALKPEISSDKIIFTNFYDINTFPSRLKQILKGFYSPKQDVVPSSSAQKQNNDDDQNDHEAESTISYFYRRFTNIPDKTIGWYPTAVKEGRTLFKQWSPDIIFATVPSFTALLVAHKLAKIIDVPWVADYRDLWSDHGYFEGSVFRKKLYAFIEKRALSNCDGLITVTQSWAKHLEQNRSLPIVFAMNGYDPDDFDKSKANILYPDKLTILYAGELYEGKRDPYKLFEAMGKLGSLANDVKILLYTAEGMNSLEGKHLAIIEKHGLQDNVNCHKYIPQSELINIQLGVDILLLLRWENPKEDGVVAGKLFEYIGAEKPILSIGSITGEAADIIRDNDFGVVSNDVDEIADYLKLKLKEKKNVATSKKINPNRINFTRTTQFEKIEKFISKIIKNNAR